MNVYDGRQSGNKIPEGKENGNSLLLFFRSDGWQAREKEREREIDSTTFLYSNTAGWIVKVNWSENPLSFSLPCLASC